MAAAVQGIAAIGYVANNLRYGPQALAIYQAVGSGGGEQHVVLPAGGGQGVQTVTRRRGPSTVQGTPVKRQRLTPKVTPKGRFRLNYQNRRRRRNLATTRSIHRFVVSRRGRRPKFVRYFL